MAAYSVETLAHELEVNPSAVRWLADYIARQTPDGNEDLLSDPNWIAACASDWLAMNRRMAADALRKPDQAWFVITGAIQEGK